MDDVLDKLNIGKVNYIKIDVEGAEFEVLKGLEKTLKKHRPVVIVEVLEDPSKLRNLSQQGYDVKQIAPQYYILAPFERCPS
ncbi:MAG: FkbM family methyltransferase [Candidatus Njordarchaeales archaeon]